MAERRAPPEGRAGPSVVSNATERSDCPRGPVGRNALPPAPHREPLFDADLGVPSGGRRRGRLPVVGADALDGAALGRRETVSLGRLGLLLLLRLLLLSLIVVCCGVMSGELNCQGGLS